MGPDTALPLPPDFDNAEDFVESLLDFTTSSWLLQTLCGGVHILDFYTRSPDLYSHILPQSWRDWFQSRAIMDILDLLMRDDIISLESTAGEGDDTWRGGSVPPKDLVQYVKHVRKHLLARDFPPPGSGLKLQKPAISRHVSMGMKVKKVHEVDNFARYIDRLTADIATAIDEPITHLVDFGSGQNYLGRALAAPPYSKHIVAVESKQHNIEGAKNMDVLAKLVPKTLVMRNKKEYRAKTGTGKKGKKGKERGWDEHTESLDDHDITSSEQATSQPEPKTANAHSSSTHDTPPSSKEAKNGASCLDDECTLPSQFNQTNDNDRTAHRSETMKTTTTTNLQMYIEGHGSVQYVEHIIKDGDLTPVIDQVLDTSAMKTEHRTTGSKLEETVSLEALSKPKNVNAMVISLHSCGNLVHHGLRSLLLDPHISAVAMVGCCYNLVTERLGPPTYKLPSLRPNHPRLVATSNAFDPHGFPMSERLANYLLPHPPLGTGEVDTVEPEHEQPRGIRLNITARMMAVQAPFNWGREDSDLFFTRHFYRSLLQRIFLDRGVVSAPVDAENMVGGAVSANGHTSHVNWTPPNGRGPGISSDGTSTPLTIGSLRKFAYSDFISYVRAAVDKLVNPNSFCEVDPEFIREKMDGLTDEDIKDYEARFANRKKELSVMWSLMAFSAGVVESVIVTDRWLWLKEQKEIAHAWVEPVFEYKHSPRNLVVVGIKK